MKLLTAVQLPHYPFKITYKDKLFFIGSCFSNEMSEKFQYYGYSLMSNPYGTVYNSRAMRHQIESIADEHYDFTHWLQEVGQESVSLLHNTEYRNTDKNELFAQIQKQAAEARKAITTADYFFLTLGTANVYRHKQINRIVANNQKLPVSEFERESLSVEEIVTDLTEIKQMVNQINQNCKLIVTISPVRHLKDGLSENQRSKAKLVLAVEKICREENAFYFPSYEIALDELRDYRFYANDMAHLNELGINCIWEKVKITLLSDKEGQARTAVEKLRKLQQHKVVDLSKQEEHNALIERKRAEILEKFSIKI